MWEETYRFMTTAVLAATSDLLSVSHDHCSASASGGYAAVRRTSKISRCRYAYLGYIVRPPPEDLCQNPKRIKKEMDIFRDDCIPRKKLRICVLVLKAGINPRLSHLIRSIQYLHGILMFSRALSSHYVELRRLSTYYYRTNTY
jgi:hypothetical protein